MKAWLELARISNLPTAWTNTVAAWLLVGGTFGGSAWIWALVASSAMYIGGMILNDAVDYRFDQKYRPERPIPSGRVSLLAAWVAGLGLLLAGAYLLLLMLGASKTWVMALAVAILVYDFYHKAWSGSVWVMGACRTLLYIAVASCLIVNFREELVARSVALGLYIVGLTVIARSESGTDKPGVGAKLGFLGLLAPALVGAYYLALEVRYGMPLFDLVANVALLVVFMAWIWRAIKVMKTPPKSNIGRSVGLLLAGVVLIDGINIGLVQPLLALAFILIAPLLLLWQRKIAAT